MNQHPASAGNPAQNPAQGPQIQVRNLFPTPVAILPMPGSEAVNAALKETILSREASTPGVQHSNWGGWQSATDFEQWCGPEGHHVLQTAQNLARQLTCDRARQPVQLNWRMNAWANVNRQGQGNEFHTHPGAYWSATYYVSDGGAGTEPDIGGEFEIQDPRGVGPAMLAPLLAFSTASGQSVGANEVVVPKAGSLVMFPSWLSHGVRPYYGQDVRISIALNLTPA